jgi:hypothetical protein
MLSCRSLRITLYCSALAVAITATASAQPTPADDGAPYGGPYTAPGSSRTPGLPPPSGGVVCSTGPPTIDPCVLTGQNNRYRTSVNVHEPTLAGMSSGSNFGMTQLYQVNSTPPGTFAYEPVVAQPLYVTNVPQSGEGNKNLLVVASLNDFLYAFDTSSTGETVTPLWSVNLAGPYSSTIQHCQTTGAPFHNNHTRLPGAVVNLEYYGAVATPVIDTGNTPPAVVYVVSACTATWGGTSVKWFLDAIDLGSGTDLASTQIGTGTSFLSSNQLSRASLLITHPSSGGTYLYVAFGEGVSELAAAANSQWQYSDVIFNYPVTYSSGSVSFGTPVFWSTSGATTSAFPSVYTSFNTSGAPQGPPCTSSALCDHGDNWAVNQGGIWMSGKGPSADSSANVYAGAGNGPFGCYADGTSQCTNASNVYYWGESAFKFTSPTATAPSDFFAPYVQRYSQSANDSNYLDTSPAAYQTEELSRVDQDFGLSGIVLLPFNNGATYATTSDKSGFVYVMPAGSNSLGQFKTSDAGLTGGTISTQIPFQGSRNGPNNSTSVCPVNDPTTGQFSNTACDEIHELAWNYGNMYIWPAGETVEVFLGAFSNSNNTYSFPTTPTYDPCNTSGNCGTGAVPFPTANAASPGGAMAIATNGSTALGTLWAIVPQANSAGATGNGTLYAYTMNSGSSLTELWASPAGAPNAHSCYTTSPPPPASRWFAPSFTEPTLAAGTVYVPTYCSVTSSTAYIACGSVPSTGVASGVLAFSTCP